jgi:hypothetical protein
MVRPGCHIWSGFVILWYFMYMHGYFTCGE